MDGDVHAILSALTAPSGSAPLPRHLYTYKRLKVWDKYQPGLGRNGDRSLPVTTMRELPGIGPHRILT